MFRQHLRDTIERQSLQKIWTFANITTKMISENIEEVFKARRTHLLCESLLITKSKTLNNFSIASLVRVHTAYKIRGVVTNRQKMPMACLIWSAFYLLLWHVLLLWPKTLIHWKLLVFAINIDFHILFNEEKWSYSSNVPRW